MRTKILVTLLAIGLVIACSKDKYTTKPQLVYKSVNTTVISSGQTIRFQLEVTDSEGDLQDSLWVQKTVKNCNTGSFTQPYLMPQFTKVKNFKGQIEICYALGTNLGCTPLSGSLCPSDDSTFFKFWIKDVKKNVSDTVSSEMILFKK